MPGGIVTVLAGGPAVVVDTIVCDRWKIGVFVVMIVFCFGDLVSLGPAMGV